MGLLKALGRGGMEALESGAMFGQRQAPRADVPLLQQMRQGAMGGPNPMAEMGELAGASRVMQRLQQERRMATDPAEIADIDAQIAELRQLLGM